MNTKIWFFDGFNSIAVQFAHMSHNNELLQQQKTNVGVYYIILILRIVNLSFAIDIDSNENVQR